MRSPYFNEEHDRLDSATKRRLGQLRKMPVELGALRDAMEAEIGPAPAIASHRRRWQLGWLSPMRAAAASLLVCGLIAAVVISASSGPALASVDQLARIHTDVQGHEGDHACHVNSIAEANAALAKRSPGVPSLPEVPGDHIHFCCVRNLGRKAISCASMMVGEKRVTIAVADAKDVRVPTSEQRIVDGQTYFLQAKDNLNMVMTNRNGKWICAMGEVDKEALLELTRGLRS